MEIATISNVVATASNAVVAAIVGFFMVKNSNKLKEIEKKNTKTLA